MDLSDAKLDSLPNEDELCPTVHVQEFGVEIYRSNPSEYGGSFPQRKLETDVFPKLRLWPMFFCL